MNRIVIGTLVLSGVGAALVLPNLSHAQTTHTGTVERVWEDGFRLNTGDRSLRVDAWSVYGDNTANAVRVGDELTVTGEFEGREFDAFTITGSGSPAPTAAAAEPATTAVAAETIAADVPARSASDSYSGRVERVWEDGFQLNVGNRTLRVDAWDVYGDNTGSYISVGDRVTITGEFENGKFDAFTIRPNP